MNTAKTAALGVLAALIVGGAVLYFTQSDHNGKDGKPPPPSSVQTAEPPAASEPEPKFPITNADDREANEKPEKAEKAASEKTVVSDDSFLQELTRLIGSERFAQIFDPADLIRHIVISVENSTGRQIPRQFLPFILPDSDFIVQGEGEGATLSSANFARYDRYMSVVRDLNIAKLMNIYRRFYPLFQSAYHEVGMKGYFNDRVVQVIDSLVDTPAPDGPIALLLEGNRYKYAEARLEALNGGQKILLRIGPENARVVKAKLQEIRRRLTQK